MISREGPVAKYEPVDLSRISVGNFVRAYQIISPEFSHANEQIPLSLNNKQLDMRNSMVPEYVQFNFCRVVALA